MTKRITGLLFGDKGYINQGLFDDLYDRGLKLVTGIKNKMKNKLMPLMEKILLRKRSIIQTVFSVLKGSFELEHTRHRSVWNAFVHILSALVAYCYKTYSTFYNNAPSNPELRLLAQVLAQTKCSTR